jgi:lysyl oxidase
MTKNRIITLGIAASLAITAATVAISGQTADLLPDLVMLQPTDFHLEKKPKGRRLLRFSTVILNMGPGVFDVYGYDPNGYAITSSSRLAVRQRIQNTSEGFTEHETGAEMFFAGDGHNHWHVSDLQSWMLAFEATPNDAVATGAKRGFCFWDNVDQLSEPSYYDGYGECHLDTTTSIVPMGLSVGWGDRYPWNIAYQYIDISRLPYGNYCLSVTADPRRDFIETSTSNNTTRTLISIRSGRVVVLGEGCV